MVEVLVVVRRVVEGSAGTLVTGWLPPQVNCRPSSANAIQSHVWKLSIAYHFRSGDGVAVKVVVDLLHSISNPLCDL